MAYPYNNNRKLLEQLYSNMVSNNQIRQFPNTTSNTSFPSPRLNTSFNGNANISNLVPQLPAVIPELDSTFTDGWNMTSTDVPFYNPKYTTKKPTGTWGATVQNTAPKMASAGTNYLSGGTGAKKGLFGGFGASNVGNKLGGFSNALGNFSLQGVTDYAKGVNQSYQAATGNPLWSKSGGIDKLGGLANLAGILMQGGQAVSGLYDNDRQADNLDDLMSDIESSAYANPLASSYLNADQRRTLRDIQKDRFDDPSISDALGGAMKGIPKALLSAVGGYLTGGVPGAAIQGIGTLVNSGIQGYGSAIQDRDAELQALYEALSNAEQDYNSMRRPANLRGAGLSSRAYNSLY